MRMRTDGMVIREQTISENDKLVTLLTQSKGVIRAFAHGAKSARNRKSAGTQMFCYCDFEIYSGRGVFSVEEATVKETFFGLRNSIQALALAQYFCELAAELSPREEEAGDYLKLLLNACYMLVSQKRDRRLLKPIVELRFLVMAGYMPSLLGCESCGAFETDTMYFNTASGELFCDKCNNNKANMPVSISTVTAMRHVAFSDFNKLFSFNLRDGAMREFGEVVEEYLLRATMRKYKTLDFYKIVE
ncbi:MAG: DNA repair protein RecO [Oscillospiraceae bacterium]|nr:DNA repair protein RecO [Oscillospiraceae bacterium]